MSKNKFVNIPPSVLALTQLARLRVTNNPVIPSRFWLFPNTQREEEGKGVSGPESYTGRKRKGADPKAIADVRAQSDVWSVKYSVR